jgi:hypothetical protein
MLCVLWDYLRAGSTKTLALDRIVLGALSFDYQYSNATVILGLCIDSSRHILIFAVLTEPHKTQPLDGTCVCGQRIVNPPSILISAPLMLLAKSWTSMLTACATSPGSAKVPVGTNF